MSQPVVNFSVPVALNWKEHSEGSVITVTGDDTSAVSSFGLAKWVMPLKIGKYVTAASRKPARMIGLRPILSDSQPNRMKAGVPSASATTIMICAVMAGTLMVWVRKNSA